MLKETIILTTFWLLTNLFAIGQTSLDTTEFINENQLITYCKQIQFNNTLFIIDTLTKDTIEFDRQISQNTSICILYQNNKPKYKIVTKAYYDKKAKKIRRAERHHNFQHRLPRQLRFRHKTCFFPTFYYGKSAKVKNVNIYEKNKWGKFKDNTIKPEYALFDSTFIRTDGKVKVKF